MVGTSSVAGAKAAHIVCIAIAVVHDRNPKTKKASRQPISYRPTSQCCFFKLLELIMLTPLTTL